MADDAMTGATRILGLIADPVVQARSPAMATALLRERGRFGEFVLVPLATPAAALDDVLTGLRRVESFAGAIVSMPHKIAIVPLLDELTPAHRRADAERADGADAALHGRAAVNPAKL